MKKTYLIFGLVFVLMLLFSGITAGETVKKIKETYEVETDTVLIVRNFSGNITISEWEEETMEVETVFKTKKTEDEFEKVESAVTEGKEFKIETKLKKKSVSADVNYNIKIPKKVIIGEIYNVNGEIKIEGGRGNAYVENVNGNVEIKNLDGYIDCMTTNGEIKVIACMGIKAVKNTNGDIKIEVFNVHKKGIEIKDVNGNIRVYFAKNISANLVMKTINGGIHLNDVNLKQPDEGWNSLSGKLSQGGDEVTIKTINGDINIHLLK